MGMICKVEEVLKNNSVYYNELKGESDIHSADDLVLCLSELKGHMVRHIDGSHGVHAGHTVG